MKQYIKLLFVAVFATMSLSLVSCGDDDEPNSNGNGLTINGTPVKISEYSFSLGGFPNTDYYSPDVYGEGVPYANFDIITETTENGITSANEAYQFYCLTDRHLNKGDIISNMEIKLYPLTDDNDEYDEGSAYDINYYVYKSGEATIISTDKENSEITIRFKELTMKPKSGGGKTFVFDGTATTCYVWD